MYSGTLMVHSQKISLPAPRNVIENSEGEFQMSKFLKRNYKAKLEFLEEWEGSNQKTFCGRGMDIFWNNIFHDKARSKSYR